MGTRGFLLLDALLTALLITLVASVTFGVLAAAFNEAGRADRRLAAEGLAADALATARTACRDFRNPAGQLLEAGSSEEALSLGNRRFSLNVQKEVISSCPGLFRLSVRAVPLDGAAESLTVEAAQLSVLAYDPW